MRIGILGGTFDPPHYGHLALARAAQQHLDLDEVMFVPASRNPLKSRPTSPARDRIAMVERLLDGAPGLTVSDIEVSRGGESYALETVEELSMTRPADYWWLLGADALRDLPGWHRLDRLLRICRIGAVARDRVEVVRVLGSLPPDAQRRIDPIPMQSTPVSSSKIRESVYKREPTDRWLPQTVAEYIQQRGLYQD